MAIPKCAEGVTYLASLVQAALGIPLPACPLIGSVELRYKNVTARGLRIQGRSNEDIGCAEEINMVIGSDVKGQSYCGKKPMSLFDIAPDKVKMAMDILESYNENKPEGKPKK